MKAAARLAFLALLIPIAGWAQEIDVSNDSITCNTVIGYATFSPPLRNGGTATSIVMHVKGWVAGCLVTGPEPVSILSGRLSGKLTGTSNECLTLAQPLSGTLTMKWKAERTTPIVPTSSTLTVTNVSFSVFAAPWGTPFGVFSLGTSGVSGAFTGGDQGATSSNASATGQDIGEIVVRCGSPTGLRKLYTGLGRLVLQ